jgi:hypothetical protein
MITRHHKAGGLPAFFFFPDLSRLLPIFRIPRASALIGIRPGPSSVFSPAF